MRRRFFGKSWRAYETVIPPFEPEQITSQLRGRGIAVEDVQIPIEAYRRYAQEGHYPDPSQLYGPAFSEKALEHFLSFDLLALSSEDVVIDIASQWSPFPEIIRKKFGCTVYRQDLDYRPGLHGDRIGGNAARLPLPDASVTKMSLHCSFEHFERKNDIAFVREAARVLKPGGRVCIIPLYLNGQFVNQTDPVFPTEEIPFDKEAKVVLVPGWNNRFGRYYSVDQFCKRIVGVLPVNMELRLYRFLNEKEIDPICYLKFGLVLEKCKRKDARAQRR